MSSTWLFPNWLYRQELIINNTDLVDYENIIYKVELDTETEISNGRMRNDCRDILVSKQEETILLPRYIKPGTENTLNTEIFIRFDKILIGSTKVYVYWGNNEVIDLNSDFYHRNPLQKPIESHKELKDLDLSESGHTGFTEDLQNIFEITKEPTGFTNNENIIVTYDSVNRTIKLEGDFEAYYLGNKVLELTDGWVSESHPLNPTASLYLKYNSNGFEWSYTPWKFSEIQIAYISVNSAGDICFAQREVHGFMDWSTHKVLHNAIGTLKLDGGDLSDYTFTDTEDRQPDVSGCVIVDGDLKTIIPELTTKQYTLINRTGAGDGIEEFTGQTNIVRVSGDQPYYNLFTGGNWTQTLMDNDQYMSIWLIAIPVTSDSFSQSYRFVWVQGQSQGTLASQRALTSHALNLGDLTELLPKFVFISKIIIHYIDNNWSITEVEQLTGNKFLQVDPFMGKFLSSVSVDGVTITGNGTPSNPLVVIGGGGGGAGELDDLTDVEIVSPSDNQILQYDSGDSKWKNENLTVSPLATTMGVVVHGADNTVARPSGYTVVTWIGSVDPNNKEINDVWLEV